MAGKCAELKATFVGNPIHWLILAVVLFCSSGATCRPWSRPNVPLAPVAFTGPPTLDEVLYSVNDTSNKVQRLSTDSATLVTPGAPGLRATMALERPLRFRLRGRLIGQELDLGSNQELFWFWARSDPENALYYAYHQQFVQTSRNTVLPVGPDWLIEALGLVQMDPSGVHEGPQVKPDGGLVVRSRVERPGGSFYRLLTIDPKYGWVTEQRLVDLAGTELAVARASNHVYYPEAGVSLPHRIQISLPPAQLSFQLEVGRYTVNPPSLDTGGLFEIPSLPEVRLVNLAEMATSGVPTSQPVGNGFLPPSSPGQNPPIPGYPPGGESVPNYRGQGPGTTPRSAYQMRYRGFTTVR